MQQGRSATAIRGTAHPPSGHLGRYVERLTIFIKCQLVVRHQKLPLYIDPPIEPDSCCVLSDLFLGREFFFGGRAGAGRGTWPTRPLPREWVFIAPRIRPGITPRFIRLAPVPDENAPRRGAAKPCGIHLRRLTAVRSREAILRAARAARGDTPRCGDTVGLTSRQRTCMLAVAGDVLGRLRVTQCTRGIPGQQLKP